MQKLNSALSLKDVTNNDRKRWGRPLAEGSSFRRRNPDHSNKGDAEKNNSANWEQWQQRRPQRLFSLLVATMASATKPSRRFCSPTRPITFSWVVVL